MKIPRTLKRLSAAACGVLLLAPAHTCLAREHDPVANTESHRRPIIQIALLLDTSNSMDGLIDQARTRLWQIVNDLAHAKRDGARPRLQVALYEYGNDRLSPEGNYIREVSAFTDDLDVLSEKLFALRTDGGSEYCGAVIKRATEQLGWTNDSDDLRLVFIAGNEPFNQGPINFRQSVRNAVARGITVNTIFCGAVAEAVATHWTDGASIGEGTFATIDQNQATPTLRAPQDEEIARLNEQLNHTYVAYGAQGAERQRLQSSQDSNATAAAPSVAAERAVAKSGSFYRNSTWDLVDAVAEDKTFAGTLSEDELPAGWRDLSPEERNQKIESLAQERARIQERIRKLAAERETYVSAEHAKLTTGALDQAILQSVRDQAQKKNYSFE